MTGFTLNLNRLLILTAACLVAASAFFVSPAYSESVIKEPMSPGRKSAPLKYALRLPNHCGWDYFGRTEPQYQRMPQKICGPVTNHFCGALILMMQAKDARDIKKKRQLLKIAEKEILYTKNGIAKYPNCPLHKEVNSALHQVQMTKKLLGFSK